MIDTDINSMYPHVMSMIGTKENFTVVDTTTVDAATWYTVSCSKPASMWIRETYKDREDDLWYEHVSRSWVVHSNQFDIHEKLYTMLSLRWSQ